MGYKVRTIVCEYCGKIDTRSRPSGQKFCSLECYRMTPKGKKGLERKCGYCGCEIYVMKCHIKEINYCSRDCHNKAQSNKIEYTCKTCGKGFKWSPSRTTQANPTYCSIECRNLCPDWKRKAVIEGNLVQQNRKTPSSLEILGSKILDKIGVEYKTQVLIGEKFTVDVLIESCNLIIQWDGDYWHGFNGAITKQQLKRQRLDRSQDAYMLKMGYKILRFWEHEVKKEGERVYEDIRKTIQ